MDYSYINQLLERYWECQTTQEEEVILRTFFSQADIPASLLPYRDLFAYERQETREDVLGDDFDKRILRQLGELKPVKAHRVSMTQRLFPLFKAAAIVAFILTLGNAMQEQFSGESDFGGVIATEQNERAGLLDAERSPVSTIAKTQETVCVSQSDSAIVDTLHHRSSLAPASLPSDGEREAQFLQ